MPVYIAPGTAASRPLWTPEEPERPASSLGGRPFRLAYEGPAESPCFPSFGRDRRQMLGVGLGTAIAGGGYTDTDEGTVIAASFLDNFNKVVASLESNPNMDQYGASGDETVTAGEDFTAGDVVMAKIDNINLLTAPEAGSEALGSVTSADALVYLGTEENGYLQVQSSSGQGWINKLLVAKQR